MLRGFRALGRILENQRVVVFIDEFDNIPQTAAADFLYALRRIYISRTIPRSPHSLGIVGVKSIEQLNADRSASPFNIHDDFALLNFTPVQVQELLGQYTDETGQPFASKVIESIHKQTGGHPFLVNRFAQILTEEMEIPKTETITMTHFSEAHIQLLDERNTNIEHLLTNIRKNRRFETILMQIVSYENSVRFNPDNDIINELATYGVITRGRDRKCEIANPIYLYRIIQAFKPIVNGLERDYFPQNTDGFQYLTSSGQIQMERLLDNFRDFIWPRAGFRILQVPETPQEFIGQHLLFAYLDQFVTGVNGAMYMEVPTGRGRMDLIILHTGSKYIVETKIWRSERHYTEGKQQFAAYLVTEGVTEGLLRGVRSPRGARTANRDRNHKWIDDSELRHSCGARKSFKRTRWIVSFKQWFVPPNHPAQSARRRISTPVAWIPDQTLGSSHSLHWSRHGRDPPNGTA